MAEVTNALLHLISGKKITFGTLAEKLLERGWSSVDKEVFKRSI